MERDFILSSDCVRSFNKIVAIAKENLGYKCLKYKLSKLHLFLDMGSKVFLFYNKKIKGQFSHSSGLVCKTNKITLQFLLHFTRFKSS